MDFEYLIKGIIVGIAVSIPLGPMSMMVIQRTLNRGRVRGFVSGIGVATSDTLYSVIAGFGLTFIVGFVTEYQDVLKLIAAVVFIILGIRMFMTNPAKEIRSYAQKKSKSLLGSYFTMFLFALTNPVSILITGGLFATFGLMKDFPGFDNISFLILGVVLGAVSWWFNLTLFVSRIKGKLRLRNLLWINRIAGVVITSFGLLLVIIVFFELY
jgi:threonine/homoserine/homoserine lactone efflux protein